MGCCKSLMHLISDNNVPVDPIQQEQDIRNEHPKILRQDEKCEMAFKGGGGSGRDFLMFTTRRILVRDVKGITGSKIAYKSVPYELIRAFAVETPGSMDLNSELKIWAKGIGKISINFVHDAIDIFSLKRYLNNKVLPKKSVGAAPAVVIGPPDGPEPGKVTEFLNFLGQNAAMLDPKAAEAQLRSQCEFLTDDENVEIAYKVNGNRDFTCFTNKRILFVDVKGITGTRKQYRSILWEYCCCFSVETAGKLLDMDCEMKILHRVTDMNNVYQDFRKSGVNILLIQEYISNKILGMDTQPELGIPKTPELNRAAGENQSRGKMGDLMAWLGDDMKMLDPNEADAQFHAGGETPLLQGCEKVEMAFKGRRDMVLFTTKRFIDVDVQGFLGMGKKTSYFSLPWKSVKAFAVESAGSWDKDSELKLWPEINDITPGHPPQGENDPEKKPEPGWSCKSMDFRKDKVDLFAIQKYLAQRIIPSAKKQVYKPPELDVNAIQADAKKDSGIMGWMSGLMDKIGSDYTQIDVGPIQQQFSSEPPILLDEELVIMAFKCGRDLWLYTSRRLLKVDTQGFTGQRVEYLSIPYKSIKAFSVECAGSWDRDADVKIYIQAPWMPKIEQDFRAGKADIIAIQNFLAAQVIGQTESVAGLSEEGSKAAAQAAVASAEKSGMISKFFDWIGDNSRAINAQEIDKQLHESPKILMNDEKAELAFQCGRDMFVITNKRMLKIDVQGFTGKKVEWLTIPLESCATFSVESAGSWDFDGEAQILTDIPDRDYYGNTWYWRIDEDFRQGKVDLMTVQEWLSTKLMAKSQEMAIAANLAMENNPSYAYANN